MRRSPSIKRSYHRQGYKIRRAGSVGPRAGTSPAEDPTGPDRPADRPGLEYDPKHPPARLGGLGRQGGHLVSKEAGSPDSTEHKAAIRPATGGGRVSSPRGRDAGQEGPRPAGATWRGPGTARNRARREPSWLEAKTGKGANPRRGGSRAGRGSERPLRWPAPHILTRMLLPSVGWVPRPPTRRTRTRPKGRRSPCAARRSNAEATLPADRT